MPEDRIGSSSSTPDSRHFRFEVHEGRTILIVDYRETDRSALVERVHVVRDFVLSRPLDSVLQLTLLNDDPYPAVWMQAIIQAMREQKGRMRAAAVVGPRKLKAAVNAVNRITGRRVRVFDDSESAILWLVQEADEHR